MNQIKHVKQPFRLLFVLALFEPNNTLKHLLRSKYKPRAALLVNVVKFTVKSI
jgi:hypothetical protein